MILNLDQEEVVFLMCIGKTQKQISELLGEGENTVGSRAWRARLANGFNTNTELCTHFALNSHGSELWTLLSHRFSIAPLKLDRPAPSLATLWRSVRPLEPTKKPRESPL
jgi:DNA-binding NarL/FixJ family response regulator